MAHIRGKTAKGQTGEVLMTAFSLQSHQDFEGVHQPTTQGTL